MAQLQGDGVQVEFRHKGGDRVTAYVGDKCLGPVESVQTAAGELGWATVRVPLRNVVFVEVERPARPAKPAALQAG